MSNHMIGDYTAAEIAAMTADEVEDAQDRDFKKPAPAASPSPTTPQGQLASSAADPYAPVVWAQREYDFITPSGQRCRMRKLRVEEVAANGLIDRIAMLPGYTQELVDRSEGKPPAKELPDKEQMAAVIDILEALVPLVVVRPTVMPSDTPPDEQPTGSVLVSDIEFGDRVAIMNRALQGVSKLTTFREES